MLYMAGGGKVTRVHGPFVEDSEVEKVTNFYPINLFQTMTKLLLKNLKIIQVMI